MAAKPKVTLAIIQEMLAEFISQTRADVSTIAGAVKELALELRAERLEREDQFDKYLATQTIGVDLARLAKESNGHVGKDPRLCRQMGGSVRQVDDARMPSSD